MPYVFPGIWPFVDAAATATDRSPWAAGFARSIRELTRIGDALAQAAAAKPEHRGDILAEAVRLRELIALALDGADAAIMEVITELELPVPEYLSKPKPPAPPPTKQAKKRP